MKKSMTPSKAGREMVHAAVSNWRDMVGMVEAVCGIKRKSAMLSVDSLDGGTKNVTCRKCLAALSACEKKEGE